jgi:hypothetical protein
MYFFKLFKSHRYGYVDRWTDGVGLGEGSCQTAKVLGDVNKMNSHSHGKTYWNLTVKPTTYCKRSVKDVWLSAHLFKHLARCM